MGKARLLVVVTPFCVCCAATDPAAKLAQTGRTDVHTGTGATVAAAERRPVSLQRSADARAPGPIRDSSTPPNPEDVARARALVKRGELLYRHGEYDQAEAVLKEAITAYPFLAQANLLLGKIFLVRGSATRDMSLIQSARLMFEMAHALDSSLREAEVLLDLFVAPPLE
jgi:tetratricopeptide (TPR) repeat protein